ncbi:MAG: 16S rRNA processing protein RimM [Oscillospiraceae bacterium]|nr:16S rRNA processing protein RimM [Oscillospiraceae bacterium]
MKDSFLDVGQIVRTHGIRGEVKLIPWADSAEFLLGFKKFHIDGAPVAVKHAYVHNGAVIASLEGVDTVDKAMALKNKIVRIARADAPLPEGKYYIRDVIGASVIDDESGETLGIVKDVVDMPAHSMFVLDRGGTEALVPDVPEFIKKVDTEGGFVRIRFIEGMI